MENVKDYLAYFLIQEMLDSGLPQDKMLSERKLSDKFKLMNEHIVKAFQELEQENKIKRGSSGCYYVVEKKLTLEKYFQLFHLLHILACHSLENEIKKADILQLQRLKIKVVKGKTTESLLKHQLFLYKLIITNSRNKYALLSLEVLLPRFEYMLDEQMKQFIHYTFQIQAPMFNDLIHFLCLNEEEVAKQFLNTIFLGQCAIIRKNFTKV
ncbi:hypothetical protein HCA69_05650 [Listeria grandensis]|uniref:GntR family transcriptional regulator n=1 Tax=Listeria grandensis TaxID=1494963 RepID=A0A7X1CPB8_9LIST|nr:hypothetical protein [Listeria grandensis]MBC1935843.1 hypothetical protein [Listeria grandensis]